ncbi:unnamed protein product [Clonostachys rosea]|uniref:Peptidase A1 domain-containing protein n=1 Tax=Bionectria ochroleuca TaxID=29856 RepID=A0ABY6USK1_BIOOC|nr:unnamed protein product [Clonostachys rosea]
MPELLSWASTHGYWGMLVAMALLAATLAEGASCVPKPFVMPISNVTLGPTQSRRGVSIKLGTPNQELSVLPSWNNNNTIIYGPTCLDSTITTTKCRSDKGGFYDPAKSNTVGTVESDYKAVPDDSTITPDSYAMFTDNLTLADDFFIKDFPMMRALDDSKWGYGGYRPQHILGMNAGSTVLSALYSAKAIASRSWGYYYGRETRNDNSAGSFVLGGYDRAKTYGDGYTRDMERTENCPTGMTVTIQDLVVNLANGTDVSIFPKNKGGQGLMACIFPEKPVVFDMPVDPYFSNWESVVNHRLEKQRSVAIDFWNEIMIPGDIYDGGLTFDFGSGFRISIPNNQLVVPDRMYNDNGELWANYSSTVLRINALTGVTAGQFPALGRYFFQQAYIMANHETMQFTLWQLNPTSIQDLVVVDDKNKIIKQDTYCANRTVATETGNPTSTTTSTNAAKNDESAESGTGRSRLETGAIAGIAVGGAALIILVVFAIWWPCRRRKEAAQRLRQQRQMREPFPISDVVKEPAPNYEEFWPSQGQPHYIPQEMAVPRERVWTREMPAPWENPQPQEMAVPREQIRPRLPPVELPAM